jgi:hypothetical protein
MSESASETTAVPDKKYVLRVLVSDAEDAALYAKTTWFPEFKSAKIVTGLGTSVRCKHWDVYTKSFTNTASYDPCEVRTTNDILMLMARNEHLPSVVILINPSHSFATCFASFCSDFKCPLLCHFTSINFTFFEAIPKCVDEYTFDCGRCSVWAAELSRYKRYHVVKTKNIAKPQVALPKNKTGMFVLQASSSMNNVERFVVKYFLNKKFVWNDVGCGDLSDDEKLSMFGAIVFVPGGEGQFLGRYLIYDPHVCPTLLLPHCVHIFVNIKGDAIQCLEKRLRANAGLQTSLFVCITHTTFESPSMHVLDCPTNHCVRVFGPKNVESLVRESSDKPAENVKGMVRESSDKPAENVESLVRESSDKPAENVKSLVQESSDKPAENVESLVRESSDKPAKIVDSWISGGHIVVAVEAQESKTPESVNINEPVSNLSGRIVVAVEAQEFKNPEAVNVKLTQLFQSVSERFSTLSGLIAEMASGMNKCVHNNNDSLHDFKMNMIRDMEKIPKGLCAVSACMLDLVRYIEVQEPDLKDVKVRHIKEVEKYVSFMVEDASYIRKKLDEDTFDSDSCVSSFANETARVVNSTRTARNCTQSVLPLVSQIDKSPKMMIHEAFGALRALQDLIQMNFDALSWADCEVRRAQIVKSAVPDQTTEKEVKSAAPETEAQKVTETQERVLFVGKERTVMAQQETSMTFYNECPLSSGERYVLTHGFPVEGKYRLIIGEQHVCDSVVYGEMAEFVCPDGRDFPAGWTRIEMTNETEDRYICSPKTGQFYFSEYKVDGSHSFTMAPRASYNLVISSGTLMLKAPQAFSVIDRDGPYRERFSKSVKDDTEHILELEDGMKNVMTQHSSKKRVFVRFQKDMNNYFYPKTMEMTELYIDHTTN